MSEAGFSSATPRWARAPAEPLDEVPTAADDASYRVLEPTAALRIDHLREQAEAESDTEYTGLSGLAGNTEPYTVALKAAAEVEALDEVTVDIPDTMASDLDDDTTGVLVSDRAYDHLPEIAGALLDDPASGPVQGMVLDEETGDDFGDEDPSEEEVVQALSGNNGKVMPAHVRLGTDDMPVDEDSRLIRVMDDGSVETGPLPDEMLREALGRAPDPRPHPQPPDLAFTGVSDGDDEDSGEVPDATTILMQHPAHAQQHAQTTQHPVTADAATEIASRSGLPPRPTATRPAPNAPGTPMRPPSATFGFPGEVQEDDVDGLTAAPVPSVVGVSGPTAVPVERREPSPDRPRSLPPTHVAASWVADPAPLSGVVPRSPPSAPPPPPVGALQAGSLEFISGGDRGKRVEIGERLTIGQSRQCDVSVPGDSRLSAIHCRIANVDGHFVLTDQGSANGTVVNGQRVLECALTGGEVIMVGSTVLKFRVEAA